MSLISEPFAAVYDDRARLGVIMARMGRGGFEAYAADDHSLGLFPSPREAAAAIIMARPWVARTTATELAQGEVTFYYRRLSIRRVDAKRKAVRRPR